MSAGSNSTGRRMPNTPGSADESGASSRIGWRIPMTRSSRRNVANSRPPSRGVACRTIWPRRRHWTQRKVRMAAQPQSHSARKTEGTTAASCGAVAVAAEGTAIPKSSETNGAPIDSTVDGKWGTWPVETSNHPRRLPIPASNENGTRNLNEAVTQSQCRVRARLVLKSRVNSPAAAAKTVDCQRWLASGLSAAHDKSVYAGVMVLGPFSPVFGGSSPPAARPRE